MTSHPWPEAATAVHLPEPVLEHILRHVRQQDRLSCCALVGRAWAVAATAATIAVDVDMRATRHTSVDEWLLQHARQLTSLSLSGACLPGRQREVVLLDADLAQLQALTVRGLQLLWRTSASMGASYGAQLQIAAIPAADLLLLPALQRLQLVDCAVRASDVAALRLPQLIHLSLDNVCGPPWSTRQQVFDAFVAMLRHLPQLSSLSLDLGETTHAEVGALSTLHPAQHLLSCSLGGEGAFDFLPALATTSLTELRVSRSRQVQVVPAGLVPAAGLGMLHRLMQPKASWHPAVLGRLPQLEHLELQHLWLRHSELMVDDSARTAGLMQVLADLSRLTRLSLRCVQPMAPGEHGSSHFSALTASSGLQQLHISAGWQPLPKQVAQHMFAAVGQQQLTRLTQLCIAVMDDDVAVPLVPDSPLEDFWCLDAADIDAIAACCPVLKSLAVQGAMRCSPEALHSLLRLQQVLGLPDLTVGGPGFTNDAGPILAQMTSLEELCVIDAPGFTVAGLQHLTALRQLTSLRAAHCGCVGPLLSNSEHTQLLLAGPPDVWRQLCGKLDILP